MSKKNINTISLKKSGPAASETSMSIAEQTAAFLKSGGEINQVPSGVSGQVSLGERAKQARQEKEAKEKAEEEEQVEES